MIDFFEYNGERIGKLVKFTRIMIVKDVDKTVCVTLNIINIVKHNVN